MGEELLKTVEKKSSREEMKMEQCLQTKAGEMSSKTEVVPVLNVREKLCRIKTKNKQTNKKSLKKDKEIRKDLGDAVFNQTIFFLCLHI